MQGTTGPDALDIDGNGVVETKDALHLLRVFIGLDSATDAQKKAWDFNGDGVIDLRDVRQLLQAIVLKR